MKQISNLLAGMAIGLTMVLATSFSAKGQNVPIRRENPSYYYLEVNEVTISAMRSITLKKTVNINYGKEAPTATSYKISDEKLTGLINFENVVGALNYLGSQGWEVVSVYKRDASNNGQLTYLLRLDASKHPSTAITKSIDELLGSLTLQAVE